VIEEFEWSDAWGIGGLWKYNFAVRSKRGLYAAVHQLDEVQDGDLSAWRSASAFATPHQLRPDAFRRPEAI
jgi:hypothetical protein